MYADYAEEIRRFLIGLLRDLDLANDVLQATFVKAAEQGHTARKESIKAWLFRVAYNEAMLIRRREGVGNRAIQKVAWTRVTHAGAAHEPVVRQETIEEVREAISQLPEAQQQILRMRIYEEKSFATIAAELGIPLGTALSRMRAALKKLRSSLENE
jgi:RNA polymerase sigma-70 factor (ECF subfamily)